MSIDSSLDEVIQMLSSLHAQGRLKDGVDLAQHALSKYPMAPELVQFLHMLRMEFFASKTLEATVAASTNSRWVGHSVSQLLYRDILRDKRFDDPRRLERFGYSSCSQNDEDGMLVEVFRRLGISHGSFFEFGVGNGLQNCTFHFLQQGWSGAWVEINRPKFEWIKKYFSRAIVSGQLRVGDTPVTVGNVDEIAQNLGVAHDLDLLSIDIDGNDYHVFSAIKSFSPKVVVLEYNPMFPPPIKMVGALDDAYVYNEKTYIGASLESLNVLARRKGYRLVGCSTGGVNAIFVRNDLAGDLFYPSDEAADFFHPARYQLSFTGGYVSGGGSNFGPLHAEDS